MAEDQDAGQKTEEPSQRRLDEARTKGQVASSREVNHTLMLGAGALLVGILAPGIARDLGAALRRLLERPQEIGLDPAALDRAAAALLGEVGGALLLGALLLVGAALASGLIQNGLMVSAEPLVPKLERISPAAGAKRLFSLRSLIEFGKGSSRSRWWARPPSRCSGRPGPGSPPPPGSTPARCSACCATWPCACWPGSPCWSG